MIKNVLSKLATARTFIKAHPVKKDGRNEFSKYDYFTPEIVSKLVNEACIEADIICVFSLKQDALGFYGEVTTTDLETGESLITEMRTDKPLITATNSTQQMGGMNTYAKRYALMSLFDIEDNTIDFDAHDNTAIPKAKVNDKSFRGPEAQPGYYPQPQQPEQDGKPTLWLNKKDKAGNITENWTKVLAAIQSGKYTIADIKRKYILNKEVFAELSAILTRMQEDHPVIAGGGTDFEEAPF